MKIRIFTIIALYICISNSYSQLAMGKWRTHFAYNAIEQIAQSDNKIFAISEGSLFSIEKNTHCIEEEEGCKEYYGKMSGLNDGIISRIGFDNQNKKLLIIYRNGNIDIMSNGGTINIPDLYNKQLSVSKEVNDITFFGDRAYLSCNFGIVALNTKKNEIADSYFIGPNGSELKILSTAIIGNTIFALTQNAIYTANVNEPNLVNYEYWSTLPSLPGNGDFIKIDVFDDKLILQRSDKLYTYTAGNGWQNILSEISTSNFSISNGKLIVYSSATSLYTVDEAFSTKLIENVGEVLEAEYDSENNLYWLAGNAKGVIAATESPMVEPKLFKPLGPAINSPWSMTFAGEKLFVAAGKPKSTEWKDGYIMIYENNKWKNIDGKKEIAPIINSRVENLMTTAVNPNDKSHFFVTSFGNGVFEFKNDTFNKWHNIESSGDILQPHYLILNNPSIYNNYTRLDGATYDSEGNIFFTNSSVSHKIKIFTKEGKWEQLKFPSLTNANLGQILINRLNTNHKWIMTSGLGILNIYDDKGTITDNSDDNFIAFESFPDPDNEGGKITHAKEYCIVQDKNNVIWLGTDAGPLLFYNTTKAFDAGYTCSRVKIPRNDGTGLADYLLQSEKIKAIAIDAANRKWIGTETSGVYLLSENGQETIKHFTTTNSPLTSNDIMSIAINPVTGEVFFGTGEGLVSFQSDASEADSTFQNVHAYPNPIKEDYNGIITITGLVNNTHVKITDLNGNLIYQTISNGSIATWDGKNTNRTKVSTGIYLAICSNEDGTQSAITKIMVIN